MKKPQWKDIFIKPLKEYTDKELRDLTKLANEEVGEWNRFLKIIVQEKAKRLDKNNK